MSWAVKGGTNQIRVIENWPVPGRGNPTSEKVPSIISYDNGSPSKWGFQVGDKDESFKWFKILLEADSKYAKESEIVNTSSLLLSKLEKTPTKVVADYLSLLWQFALKDIAKKKGKGWRSIYDVKIVMSVPAMWSPAAKEKTLQAAKDAGLEEFDEDIQLVTEPEAAALATLRDKADLKELRVSKWPLVPTGY